MTILLAALSVAAFDVGGSVGAGDDEYPRRDERKGKGKEKEIDDDIIS